MELQAVIMAGGYSEATGHLSYAKPLLPIGKKKLIWFPVNWLKQSGFESVIIITLDSMKFDIEEAISDIQIQTKFIACPDANDFGTLDSLCLLEQHINKHASVLVVNCDIITNIKLHKFVDIHRLHDSTVTLLLAQNKEKADNIPGSKTLHQDQERDCDIIGLSSLSEDKNSNIRRIIFAIDEFDLKDENLQTKRELSLKFNKIETRLDLEDCHLYIISRWLLNYIFQNLNAKISPTMKLEGSFRRDFLPYIINKQFTYDPDGVITTNDVTMQDTSKLKYDEDYEEKDLPPQQDKTDIYYHAQNNKSEKQKIWSKLNISTRCKKSRDDDVIICNSMVIDDTNDKDDGDMIICVNNIAKFVQATRMLFKPDIPWVNDIMENLNKIPSNCQIAQKTTITNESVMDERCEVGEKTVIKRSIIGKNCKISPNVRISNCIIMDHVNIASGCNLQGTVICSNSTIHEKCEIKDSFIASNKSIKANSKHTRESLMPAESNELEI